MKRNEKVVPYLDLPIQHCNDTSLKKSNRRSNRAELLEVIGKLRREIPGITLRTTLIEMCIRDSSRPASAGRR